MIDEAPRPVSDKVVEITLTGCLFPVYEDRQPVLLRMAGAGDDLFWPVFSTYEKLVEGMALAKTPFDRVQQIVDGVEFLQSVEENPGHIRVILDLYAHESGRVRFKEVFGST